MGLHNVACFWSKFSVISHHVFDTFLGHFEKQPFFEDNHDILTSEIKIAS